MTQFGVYYYPAWAASKTNEWDLVLGAKPYFKGHRQPRIPLHGTYDCAQPGVITKQATLAREFGIDAFIYDWYWKQGARVCEDALRNHMQENPPLDFSIMWCWKLPKTNLPVLSKSECESEKSRWIDTNVEDFKSLLHYCATELFSHKKYWRIDGRPLFLAYFYNGFLGKLGESGFQQLLNEGRKYVQKLGEDPLFTLIVTNPDVKDVGWDAYSQYNFIPLFEDNTPHLQNYDDCAKIRAQQWQLIQQRTKKPIIPSVSAGWDATPRGERLVEIDRSKGFPWSPIVVDGTPKQFGEQLDRAIALAKTQPYDVVNICAWNEWSEGAHIEPDTIHKFGYLEEVKKRSKK